MKSTYTLNINYFNRCNSLFPIPSNYNSDNKLYKMSGTYIKMDIIYFNYDTVDVCEGPVFDPK